MKKKLQVTIEDILEKKDCLFCIMLLSQAFESLKKTWLSNRTQAKSISLWLVKEIRFMLENILSILLRQNLCIWMCLSEDHGQTESPMDLMFFMDTDLT